MTEGKGIGRCKVEMREKGGRRETAAEETFDGPLWWALISDRQHFTYTVFSHIPFNPQRTHKLTLFILNLAFVSLPLRHIRNTLVMLS